MKRHIFTLTLLFSSLIAMDTPDHVEVSADLGSVSSSSFDNSTSSYDSWDTSNWSNNDVATTWASNIDTTSTSDTTTTTTDNK